MAQTRQDIEKWISGSLKGVQNEAFLVKNLEFKISIFILKFAKFAMYAKSCFIIFIDVMPLCYQWYTMTLFTLLYALF